MEDIPAMRIVVLGKTGLGKSSLANTLFEEEETFTVNHSANSETKLCQLKNKMINGINVQLVDTPGFFDTDQKGTGLKDELLKCIIHCAPGPHAFLLTLKVEKFTSQEEAVVDLMIEYFSEEALKFTTVLFTHGDQLPKGKKIEEWVKENEALQNLVLKCGGRCHVIDNKYWNNSQDPYRNNQHQIKQLLETINKTIEQNEGNCYINNLLLKVELMKTIERDRIKQSSPGISEELLTREVNKSVFTKLKKNWVGVTVGTILGALLGGLAVGALTASLGAGMLVIAAVAGVGAVGAGLLGGGGGGVVSEHSGYSGYSGSVTQALKSKAKKLLAHVKSLSKSDPEELVELLKSM